MPYAVVTSKRLSEQPLLEFAERPVCPPFYVSATVPIVCPDSKKPLAGNR